MLAGECAKADIIKQQLGAQGLSSSVGFLGQRASSSQMPSSQMPPIQMPPSQPMSRSPMPTAPTSAM